MRTTLRIALHVPGNLYRPEFARRATLFLRDVVCRLRNPNYHIDRAQIGAMSRQILQSPRYRYDVADQSWRVLCTLVSLPENDLLAFSLPLELPDDVERRAFERRVEALFDSLEIELAAEHPDPERITHHAHALVDTPRQFQDTVLSEAGHVPAWGAST